METDNLMDGSSLDDLLRNYDLSLDSSNWNQQEGNGEGDVVPAIKPFSKSNFDNPSADTTVPDSTLFPPSFTQDTACLPSREPPNYDETDELYRIDEDGASFYSQHVSVLQEVLAANENERTGHEEEKQDPPTQQKDFATSTAPADSSLASRRDVDTIKDQQRDGGLETPLPFERAFRQIQSYHAIIGDCRENNVATATLRQVRDLFHEKHGRGYQMAKMHYEEYWTRYVRKFQRQMKQQNVEPVLLILKIDSKTKTTDKQKNNCLVDLGHNYVYGYSAGDSKVCEFAKQKKAFIEFLTRQASKTPKKTIERYRQRFSTRQREIAGPHRNLKEFGYVLRFCEDHLERRAHCEEMAVVFRKKLVSSLDPLWKHLPKPIRPLDTTVVEKQENDDDDSSSCRSRGRDRKRRRDLHDCGSQNTKGQRKSSNQRGQKAAPKSALQAASHAFNQAGHIPDDGSSSSKSYYGSGEEQTFGSAYDSDDSDDSGGFDDSNSRHALMLRRNSLPKMIRVVEIDTRAQKLKNGENGPHLNLVEGNNAPILPIAEAVRLADESAECLANEVVGLERVDAHDLDFKDQCRQIPEEKIITSEVGRAARIQCRQIRPEVNFPSECPIPVKGHLNARIYSDQDEPSRVPRRGVFRRLRGAATTNDDNPAPRSPCRGRRVKRRWFGRKGFKQKKLPPCSVLSEDDTFGLGRSNDRNSPGDSRITLPPLLENLPVESRISPAPSLKRVIVPTSKSAWINSGA